MSGLESSRLLVATTNPGKFREIRELLAGLPIAVRSLEGPAIDPPGEHGTTFAENARLKALYYAQRTGELTVADDSGLEVDALDGAPGVLSARFPGDTYPERFENLYKRLEERGAANRSARFVCALALAHGARVIFEARGTVEGEIATEPRGTGGFGYDPIFFYPPLARTLAELTPEEKSRVSHRAAAFRQLRAFLLAS
jgi:XTP/dITP diphosphohydrolase